MVENTEKVKYGIWCVVYDKDEFVENWLQMHNGKAVQFHTLEEAEEEAISAQQSVLSSANKRYQFVATKIE